MRLAPVLQRGDVLSALLQRACLYHSKAVDESGRSVARELFWVIMAMDPGIRWQRIRLGRGDGC